MKDIDKIMADFLRFSKEFMKGFLAGVIEEIAKLFAVEECSYEPDEGLFTLKIKLRNKKIREYIKKEIEKLEEKEKDLREKVKEIWKNWK